VIIKGLRFIILVKSVVVVHVITLQYILIVRVADVNYRCYGYKVWNRRSSALFLLSLHLPLGLLFLLNLLLKLR